MSGIVELNLTTMMIELTELMKSLNGKFTGSCIIYSGMKDLFPVSVEDVGTMYYWSFNQSAGLMKSFGVYKTASQLHVIIDTDKDEPTKLTFGWNDKQTFLDTLKNL